MWSPSGAVGRGVLDNTCSPARFHFVFANVTLRPEAATQTLLGLPRPPPAQPCGGSVPQPTPSPSTRAPIPTSGTFPLLRLPAAVERRGICQREGIFSFAKWSFVLDFAQQVISGGVGWGSAVETRLQNEMLTASSPGSCSLSPVSASPDRISGNGLYSCPETPRGDV